MKPQECRRHATLVAMLLAACTQFTAFAAAPPLAGSYLNGGIGEEEQQALQVHKGPYNLRLTFAKARAGEYLAGLDVTIERIDRKLSFGPFADCGPLFYVRLDPGVYRVNATYEGILLSKTVRIGGNAVEDTFYWP
jgi:hypothetical protein